MDLQALMRRASKSPFYLWLLNRVLLRSVPFNSPHGLKVVDLNNGNITVFASRRRSNRNHIGGIHACLLATMCEYATGLGLLSRLDAKKYRIILKDIHMTYHYQAKMPVKATFNTIRSLPMDEITSTLEREGVTFRDFTIEVHDTEGHHICTGVILWQIKDWQKVRTAA